MSLQDIEQRRKKTNLSSGSLALRQFVRKNLIITSFTFVYLVIVVLVMYIVDDKYFKTDKNQTITQFIDSNRPFNLLRKDITDEVASYFTNQNNIRESPNRSDQRQIQLEETQKRIQAKADEILDKHAFIFSVIIRDAEGNEIAGASGESRIRQQNNYNNSLFIPNFQNGFVNKQQLAEEYVGEISIRYTSPTNYPPLNDVVQKWRLRRALILFALFAVYVGILYFILLPIRRVMAALDKGPQVGARFIAPANILLEKYYNNLARDATLSIFSTVLRGFVTEESLVDRPKILATIPGVITELFPVNDVKIGIYRNLEDEDIYSLDKVNFSKGTTDTKSEFPEQLTSDKQLESTDTHFFHPIFSDEKEILILSIDKVDVPFHPNPWWLEMFTDIGKEITFALEKIEAQRRLILEEKNKANISLSRNLGHDLTNIIATSKLELMTVKSLLNMPREKVYESPQKQEIFQESLESLLNSTRFLQETVNLYRSYTYFSKPRFELLDIRDLIQNVAHLFQLSLSKNIAVNFELDEELSEVVIEPRLLKLALFNLMSNAADSIKLGSSAEQPSGSITLRSILLEDSNFQIDIQDTGTGIIGKDGKLLSDREIENIFQLGYTTKEQGTGEGLGLNWVKQIVMDFHSGNIKATNSAEGGAIFSLIIPVRSQEPEVEQNLDKSNSGNTKLPNIKSDQTKQKEEAGN